MSGTISFGRLVRFENELGEIKYGEVAQDRLNSLVGSTVEVYGGDVPWDCAFRKSGKTDVVYKVSQAARRCLVVHTC